MLHVSHCSQVSVQHLHNRSCYAVLNEFKLTSCASHTPTRQQCSVQQQHFLVQATGAIYSSDCKAFHKAQAHNKAKKFCSNAADTHTSAVSRQRNFAVKWSRSLVLFTNFLDNVQNFSAAVSDGQRCCQSCLLSPVVRATIATRASPRVGALSARPQDASQAAFDQRRGQTHCTSLFFLRLSTEAQVSGRFRPAAVHCSHKQQTS